MNDQRSVALVTGASSGLGWEYCKQLASHFDELIAVARRGERLQALSEELKVYGVNVHCVEADLATEDGLARAVECTREFGAVSCLINNAGFGTYGNFVDQDLAVQQSMIDLHIKAVVALSYAVIPKMQALGKGTIVNVASLAAYMAMPTVSVYGASKRFLLYLSEALQEELRDSGIKIQCLSPGYTRTEFFDRDCWEDYVAASLTEDNVQSAAEVVAESLRTLDSDILHLVPGVHNRQMLAEQWNIHT